MDEIKLIIKNYPGVENVVPQEALTRPIRLTNNGCEDFVVPRNIPFKPDNLSIPQKYVLWQNFFAKPNRGDKFPCRLGVVYSNGDESLILDLTDIEVETVKASLLGENYEEDLAFKRFMAIENAKKNPEDFDRKHKLSNIMMEEHQSQIVEIARKANDLSKEANFHSEVANRIAARSNKIAGCSFFIAIISLLVAIVAVNK